MSATSVPAARNRTASLEARGKGHIGLLVLHRSQPALLSASCSCSPFLTEEPRRRSPAAHSSRSEPASLLALVSKRFTDQPQDWALTPGIGAAVVGLVILIFAPGNRGLQLAGWLWPLLLLALVVWSIRGARHSLHSWSRRGLLYPSLAILLLVAVGGAFETVAEATANNVPPAAGRTYLVDGHRLYLNCTGTGAPTVVLFNGLGERTPSWAWVQNGLSSSTRTCVFDRAGEGWSGAGPAHRMAASSPPTCTGS